MSNKIVFETDAFAATKEVWLKASDCLGINNETGTTEIKRLSPNKVQIISLSGDILAELSATVKGNKKVWSQNKTVY